MIQDGKSRSDEMCNCQAPSRAEGPWHPLGDTMHCPLALHGPECCPDCRVGLPTHRANTPCECD